VPGVRAAGTADPVVTVLPDGGERYLSTDLFEGDASEP
jgi:cysteine synthase